MIVSFSQLPKALDRFVERTNKGIRLATYQTLKALAFNARKEVIKEYPKHFPDENGIKKNKGVPRMLMYSDIDKSVANAPSIRLYGKPEMEFMEKQEFPQTLVGGTKGKSAAIPITDSLKKMRRGTRGMKDEFSISQVMSAAKKAIKPTLKTKRRKGVHNPPNPFFMKTKNGHTMVVKRQGISKNPVIPLYHFHETRRYEKNRWDFFKTVEGVVVSMTDKIWGEKLNKVLDRK